MAELKTEPGWKPAPLPGWQVGRKRPWWASALIGGLSAGAGIAGSLYLAGTQARGGEPPQQKQAGFALPPGSISLDERLRNMESTLKTLSDDMVEVKQRLPPKRP